MYYWTEDGTTTKHPLQIRPQVSEYDRTKAALLKTILQIFRDEFNANRSSLDPEFVDKIWAEDALKYDDS